MKNLIKIYLLFFTIGLFYMEACDSGVQSKGDSIHGTVIFVDSNFNTQNGTYAVALYTNIGNSPFSQPPVAIQNLSVNSSKSVDYNITYEGGGYYFDAVVWINNKNINELPIILGVHGCDTTHNCSSEIPIAFPNYTGHNFDIVSWADTVNKLF